MSDCLCDTDRHDARCPCQERIHVLEAELAAEREHVCFPNATEAAIKRAEKAEARVVELFSTAIELLNLHSGEDYRNRGTPLCPVCERARNVLIPETRKEAKA